MKIITINDFIKSLKVETETNGVNFLLCLKYSNFVSQKVSKEMFLSRDSRKIFKGNWSVTQDGRYAHMSWVKDTSNYIPTPIPMHSVKTIEDLVKYDLETLEDFDLSKFELPTENLPPTLCGCAVKTKNYFDEEDNLIRCKGCDGAKFNVTPIL